MMKRPLVCPVLLAWVCLGSIAARAEQLAPRDLWPQATAAVDSGDLTAASKKAAELTEVGRAWGIKTFPLYAESAASLTKLVSGWWSDRIGRRKPLVVFGYALATVVRPLVALATSWGQVLGIRFADRVGKGLRTPPRDALLAGLTPAESRGRASSC